MGRRYHFDSKGRYTGYSDSEGPSSGGGGDDGCGGCILAIIIWWFILTILNGLTDFLGGVYHTIFFWT